MAWSMAFQDVICPPKFADYSPAVAGQAPQSQYKPRCSGDQAPESAGQASQSRDRAELFALCPVRIYNARMRLYDISVGVSPDIPVWPGDPPVKLERVKSIEDGEEANVSQLQSGVHVGTHIDAPIHFVEGGQQRGYDPAKVALRVEPTSSISEKQMYSMQKHLNLLGFRLAPVAFYSRPETRIIGLTKSVNSSGISSQWMQAVRSGLSKRESSLSEWTIFQ